MDIIINLLTISTILVLVVKQLKLFSKPVIEIIADFFFF